jgi:hypothetical protein
MREEEMSGSGLVTQQRLRDLLHYNPKTGIFTWLVDHGRWDRIKAGTVATSDGKKPLIHVDNRKYLASRLAVLYMTGRWPRLTVDHKDCDPRNNQWSNLRQATQQEQQRNRKGYSSSGYKGVYASSGRYGFSAYISINKKSIYLGWRHTPKEAHQLYCDAVKQHYAEFGRME